MLRARQVKGEKEEKLKSQLVEIISMLELAEVHAWTDETLANVLLSGPLGIIMWS